MKSNTEFNVLTMKMVYLNLFTDIITLSVLKADMCYIHIETTIKVPSHFIPYVVIKRMRKQKCFTSLSIAMKKHFLVIFLIQHISESGFYYAVSLPLLTF